MRHTIFFLTLLWSSQSVAGFDPFGTDSMQIPKTASSRDTASTSPCVPLSLDHPLALPEVVDLALCNNPQTKELWANSRVYAAQVGVGKAAYLPNADLNAGASRNWTGTTPGTDQNSVGLSLSYLLYDFGARAANLEVAQQLLAAANASQDSTVQALFLAAVQSYYQVQATFASLNAAIESERAARETFAAAAARYNAGSATPADKLQAQTAYSQTTLNRITAEGNLKNAQGNLSNMLGLDAHRNVSLIPAGMSNVPASFDGDIAALIEQARQRRPDLQAAAAQFKAAEASADAARAADRPTISLGASTSRYETDGIGTRNSSIGVTLNVPIFTGYAPTYRIRAAEAQAEASAAKMERLHLQIALDVWTAYQNLTTASQALRTTADLLDSAEQSERVALGRYKAGVGSVLDVLNAQSALASARQQRVQSNFNWNISRAILAQSMGNLDSGLLQTLSSNPQETEMP
jgi:TolC family type I secretion outer membrane protein